MPRGATRRRATQEDLDDTQREIYNALPDHLREQYLRGLPMISISTAGNRKKAQLIRDRISLLDHVIGDLQNHRKELFNLAKGLEQGNASAGEVDLRKILKPPAINGVSMRYVRPKRG
jgi:hypothetical protein